MHSVMLHHIRITAFRIHLSSLTFGSLILFTNVFVVETSILFCLCSLIALLIFLKNLTLKFVLARLTFEQLVAMKHPIVGKDAGQL